MKSLLVLFLVATCSAAKLSSDQKAPSGALSSDGGDFLPVTVSNEYLSSPTKKRSGKKINTTSPPSESTYQYQTTSTPNQYYTSSAEPQERAYHKESTLTNQQYLVPIQERNSFNVIPQEANNVNQQYLLPPNNNEVMQEYNIQQPSIQYLAPEQTQYSPSSAEQYVVDQNSAYQQYKQHDPNQHYNAYSAQPSQDDQLQVQYLPAASNSVNNNQYSSYPYFNPIDLHQLSESAQPFESKRTSKENTHRQDSELTTPQATRRYDVTSPTPQIQYQKQDPTPSSYYSMYMPQQQQNYTAKVNYNQHKDNTYQTTQPPVYGSKANYNQYKDNTFQTTQSPVYGSKANYNQYQDSSYQTTQPPVYGTKANYNQYQDGSYQTTQPPVYGTKANYNQYQDSTYQTTQPPVHETKANYNQYQENKYQTTQPSVVEIGQKSNLPSWLNYAPSFANRKDSAFSESTRIPPSQLAQSRQSTLYGDKIQQSSQQPQQHNQQQYFASSRSSNVAATSVPQSIITPAPEKLADHLPYSNQFIPQTPSQFKPSQSQHVYQQEITPSPYQQQHSYTSNFQHPTSYQPISSTEPMPILKQTSEMGLDGSFSYETLTGDQTHIMQQGHIENKGTDHEEQVMQGSYSFIGDDGRTYTVNYIADANGFRATGDHIPTAPPIPEVIQRSIEINLAEEAAQAAQTQQGYRYPQADNNNRYPVVEQAREGNSIPNAPNYNNNNINNNNDFNQY